MYDTITYAADSSACVLFVGEFQEELELLGTVTARLCRCLCYAPIVDAQERPQQVQ